MCIPGPSTNNAASKKKEQNTHTKKLDAEQKHLSDLISSAAATNGELKEEILERVSGINQEHDMIFDV